MSISSSEGSPFALDLTAKYQKLAAEYAKVRANVAVLKKAVVDEQTRSADLKEIIKARDQTLRKHDQELESLTFRNQQLTKRVLVLQEDLDRIQDVSKKGRPLQESGVTVEESKLFQEELQTRILQNAKLLSQLDEKEQELERERRQWQNSIAQYESQLSKAQSSLASLQTCSCKTSSKINNDTPSGTLPWTVIRNLPFSILCEPLNDLIESEIGQTVPDLEKVIKVSNEHSVLPALQDHSQKVTLLISRTEKRNPMLHEFLITWRIFVADIIHFFDNTVPYPVTPNLVSAVDLLCCIAIKYNTPGIQAKVQVALESLESNCAIFQNFLKELLSSNQCQLNNSRCDEKPESSEKKISNSSKPSANGPTIETTAASDLQPKTVSNEFGYGTIIGEPVWMEPHVKEYMAVMTNSLVTDRQIAESKASSVLKECEALKNTLAHYSAESSKRYEEVKNLQEELSVTSRNYEEQLSSMSEHMANMNDKLAAQEATIEELTFELTKKDNKKSRTK